MKNNIIELCLFTATLVTGLYAGIGFFCAMGGNPAIERMTRATFAEYWQHTDHFMAARMKIFGPLMLLTLLVNVLVLLKEYRTPAFWCMLAAFCILLTDIIFTLSTNHPLNTLVQSWNLQQLPDNAEEVKGKILNAFYTRTFFMIGSFIMVLAAVWLRKQASLA